MMSRKEIESDLAKNCKLLRVTRLINIKFEIHKLNIYFSQNIVCLSSLPLVSGLSFELWPVCLSVCLFVNSVCMFVCYTYELNREVFIFLAGEDSFEEILSIDARLAGPCPVGTFSPVPNEPPILAPPIREVLNRSLPVISPLEVLGGTSGTPTPGPAAPPTFRFIFSRILLVLAR